jgi:hypothetical protein
MAMHSEQALITIEEINESIVPELLRRWDKQCYCRNKNFLKLISFDFRHYGHSPMALIDAEFVIYDVMFKRFERVSGWTKVRDGSERVDRCPQCGLQFHSLFEQYSINMDCTVSRPSEQLPIAETGYYVAGFHRFVGSDRELRKVTDFQPAASVEAFMDSITAAAGPSA